MQVLKEWQLKQLREEFPVGTRAELIYMDNPYRQACSPKAEALTAGWMIWV